MSKIKKTIIALSSSLILSVGAIEAYANDFVVRDIKIVGLQRISKGTVLNYLPLQIGEQVSRETSSELIRALYETGFFQSVELKRSNNTLIVEVVERETIDSINVVGNQEIPTDKLKEILKTLGLVKGRVFQRASLERLEKELKQVYNARGKYNARIESKITSLTENRVAINISISEGRVSRIKEIKIVGNRDFKDKELLSELILYESSMLTYFSKKDQYSKAAMDASLEALRSFYLDRGYLKFRIVSSQVLLSPDKKNVFIHIHIEEGAQYHFSGFAISGKTILPKERVASMIRVRKGDVFSRKSVTESISTIGLALGDIGFGFPAINAEPRIDEKTKTVFITFIIDPGRHVYVRRINFYGNTHTGDYVLRNVISQNEGGLLSLHNIKESERQLRHLNYLKNINVKTTSVPGANNQVDLDINLEESPSAEASASFGYGSNGPQFNASFNQFNFMGTGRTVGLVFNASYWGQDYSFNYYNPFYTKYGVGRGISLYYQTVNPKNLDVASYNSDRFGGEVGYSVLLGEATSLQFGYGYQGLRIKTVGVVQQIQNFVDEYGREFNQLRLSLGWNSNSYDQMPYPTHGANQKIGSMLVLPVSKGSLSYYKASYMGRVYYPAPYGFIFTVFGNVGFGNQFDGKGLPFYENYFAGGIAQPGQIRGYDSFSLGPQDNFGNAMGANLLVNGSMGVILPYPLTRENFRTMLFADAGNVFAVGTPLALAGNDAGPIRYSAGLSLEWRSPFGPLQFSIAKPLNLQPTDSEQMFQFSLSSNF